MTSPAWLEEYWLRLWERQPGTVDVSSALTRRLLDFYYFRLVITVTPHAIRTRRPLARTPGVAIRLPPYPPPPLYPLPAGATATRGRRRPVGWRLSGRRARHRRRRRTSRPAARPRDRRPGTRLLRLAPRRRRAGARVPGRTARQPAVPRARRTPVGAAPVRRPGDARPGRRRRRAAARAVRARNRARVAGGDGPHGAPPAPHGEALPVGPGPRPSLGRLGRLRAAHGDAPGHSPRR